MRILLSTHSAATRASFGIVAREIWKRIAAAAPEFEVVQHGWFHHPVSEDVPWEILPTECRTLAPGENGAPPALEDRFGDRTFPGVLRKIRPDLVWHLADPYMGSRIVEECAAARTPYLWYYPVAREPFNRYRNDWVRKLRAADPLVTTTGFGAEVLRAVPGLADREIPIVPHGVDTGVFRPADPETRRTLRAEIGGGAVDDDTIVLGWVGHDQFRKQVWTLFELMHHLRSGDWIRCRACGRITVMEYDHLRRAPRAPGRLRRYEPGYDYSRCWYCRSCEVARGRPREDVVLWTVMSINTDVGWDLRPLVETWGLSDVVFDGAAAAGEAGYPVERIAEIYQCLDVLVFPSGAEGFGMPVLEAMACGVPVVYGRYSAHSEFAVGLPVRVSLFPDLPDASFLGLVDAGDLLRQVLGIADDGELRRRLSVNARVEARKMDWDAFTPRWLDLLDRRTGPRGS